MPKLIPAAAEGLPKSEIFFVGSEIEFWADGYRLMVTLLEPNQHIPGAWEAFFYDGRWPRHVTIHECYFEQLAIISSQRRLTDGDLEMYRDLMIEIGEIAA